MRYRVIALFSAVLSVFALFAPATWAEEAKNDVKGLFLLTDYPAVTLRPGTTSSVSLKLQNYGLPPERLALSVAGVPAGWTVTLVGGGQPVAAALPATNASVPLELRLDVPKDAPVGTTNLTVNAQGATASASIADRRNAGDQSARQADAHPAASRTARQFEVELRVHDGGEERQRQEAHRRALGDRAAEFRRDLHRAIRQPGTQRAPARPRPVEGRQAQDQAAEYGCRRQVQCRREGFCRGRFRHQRSCRRHHRPAQDRHRGPRRPAQRTRLCRRRDFDPGRADQYGHRTG